MAYEHVIVEIKNRVGVITLNRPKALNALCGALMDELETALDELEANDDIGCIVVTGSEKAFAAGADITEMKDMSFMDAYKADFITRSWERLARARKPTIAAVAGFAPGGGCEIALWKTASPRIDFGDSKLFFQRKKLGVFGRC